MDLQKCQRCWTQKALFRCPSCEKHQILCNKCDAYIHSMNKFKLHQRFGLSNNYKNIVISPVYNKINKEITKAKTLPRKAIRKKIKNMKLYNHTNKSFDDLNNNNNFHNENKNDFSLLNIKNNTNYLNYTNSFINMKNKTFQINKENRNIYSPESHEDKNCNENKDENENNSSIFVYKYNPGNSIINNSQNLNINNSDNNFKNRTEILSQKLDLLNSNQNILINENMFNSQQNFPYEISLNNFNKGNNNEASYHSYKIKSQIEEVGKNMIGDMSQIISNITNEEKNFKNKALELELKFNNRIKEIENSKNGAIIELKKKIKEINKNNEQLDQNLKNMDQDHFSKCEELTNMITTLQNQINNKEEEIYYMKNELNEKSKIENNNNENEKNNLCYLYEEKIKDILNIAEENQKQLLDIIKEKERIIQELIEANQNKTSNYNVLINKFQRENEEFKNVTQKSIFLAGNNVHNKFLNDLDNKTYKYQKNYYNNKK